MNNKRQKPINISDIQVTAKQQLISKLVLKNLKGGAVGCPPRHYSAVGCPPRH